MRTLAWFTTGGALFATLVLRNLEASPAEWVFYTCLGTAIVAGAWWVLERAMDDMP